ncbi:hypothetical protein QEN19_001379 [Hanseniaspora menglaensis]
MFSFLNKRLNSSLVSKSSEVTEYKDTRLKCHHLIRDIYNHTSINNTMDTNKLWINYSSNYFTKKKILNEKKNKYLIKYEKLILTDEKIKELNKITLNCILFILSKRILEFQDLKTMIVMNIQVFENYDHLMKSLSEAISLSGKILNDEHDYDLEAFLQKTLETHSDNLIFLSKGLMKCEEDGWITKDEISKFLNRDIKEMILLKLICQHHLTILKSLKDTKGKSNSDEMIGIIHPNMNVSKLISHVNEFVNDMCFIKFDRTIPIKFITGEDIEFPCVPVILEYIITELLKNSSKAQIDNKAFDVPIQITILQNYNDKDNSTELEIRIRDFGNGIPPAIEDKIQDFNFTTTTSKELDKAMQDNIMPGEQVNNVSGMGYGLGIIRNFVDLINDGDFKMGNLYGYGVDCYIRFKA